MPARAAQVVMSVPGRYDASLIEAIALALGQAGLHEKARRTGEVGGGRDGTAPQHARARHLFWACRSAAPHLGPHTAASIVLSLAPCLTLDPLPHHRHHRTCIAPIQLGELYEHQGRAKDGLTAYRRGRAYRRAVDLARREFPAAVIDVEEEWGDWLASQRQNDAAVNHFIEAGQTVKAIEAALAARQFGKAAGIIDFLEPAKATPYYRRIATVRRCGLRPPHPARPPAAALLLPPSPALPHSFFFA